MRDGCYMWAVFQIWYLVKCTGVDSTSHPRLRRNIQNEWVVLCSGDPRAIFQSIMIPLPAKEFNLYPQDNANISDRRYPEPRQNSNTQVAL